MSPIDILVAIDTQAILNEYDLSPKPDDPTMVKHQNIYMITSQGNVVADQAKQELNIKASVGETIRWRETSLSMDFSNDVLFYRFVSNKEDLLAPLQPLTAKRKIAIPNDSDLLKPKVQEEENYFWNTTALAAGKVTYHFFFMILDRNGKVQGYCKWDPYITISN